MRLFRAEYVLLLLLAGCCAPPRPRAWCSQPPAPPRQPQAQPPAAPNPLQNQLADALRLNERLAAEVRALALQVRACSQAREQADKSNAGLLNELARLREAHAQLKSQPPAPPASPTPPEPAPPRPPVPSSGVLDGSVDNLALWLLGALGISTPMAFGAVLLAKLARKLSRARRPSHKPPIIAIDTPPPPQQVVPDTRFYPVEKDTFAQAYDWAKVQTVRKYPGAEGAFVALDSLIQQHLSAQGAKL